MNENLSYSIFVVKINLKNKILTFPHKRYYNILINIQVRRSQQMIYDGPILDPRHRFYVQPTVAVNNSYPDSPQRTERYAKFKAQPINLGKYNPTVQKLSRSKIYTKNGVLKRNDMGWDGVKLTQYVTEQLSDNFVQNQRILQKFRKQAQENRRKIKFGHAFERPIVQNDQSKLGHYLPQITPVSHEQYIAYPNSSNVYNPQDQYIQQQQQTVHYRNVGVNTNKLYEKVQLQKYLSLRQKYDKLKSKYNKQKTIRRYQKKIQHQRQILKQKQLKSIEKIKQIQLQLTNISVRLQSSNQLLAQHLKTISKQKPALPQINANVNKQSRVTNRKFKTEPDSNQEQKVEPITEKRKFQKTPLLQSIYIPKNPIDSIRKNQDENKQYKSPRIVYSGHNKSDSISDSRFLTKYLRK